jgi:hypothetical protein
MEKMQIYRDKPGLIEFQPQEKKVRLNSIIIKVKFTLYRPTRA